MILSLLSEFMGWILVYDFNRLFQHRYSSWFNYWLEGAVLDQKKREREREREREN
jgi:hypothetical protein